MALTFRTGPNNWCDPDFAKRMGYVEFKGAPLAPAARMPARPAPKQARPAARPAALPTVFRSNLPPAPPIGIQPAYMGVPELRATRIKIHKWLRLAGMLPLNGADRARVADQKARLQDLSRFGFL